LPDPVKSDDGEAGAGAIILQELEAAGLHDHIVVVSRWFGGVRLGGDRFRHVRSAVRVYLAQRAGLT
jgi:putative IMPACT (imprinted ancient) family translation regulator